MHNEITNIPWEFTDKKVTAGGGLRLIKEFLIRIKIKGAIKEIGLPNPGVNRGYDSIKMIESFWVSVWIGGVSIGSECEYIYEIF